MGTLRQGALGELAQECRAETELSLHHHLLRLLGLGWGRGWRETDGNETCLAEKPQDLVIGAGALERE